MPPQPRVALLSLRACALEMVGDIGAAIECADQATTAGAGCGRKFKCGRHSPCAAAPGRVRSRGLARRRWSSPTRGSRIRSLLIIPARRAWMFHAWYALILIALGRLPDALELIDKGTRSAERYSLEFR